MVTIESVDTTPQRDGYGDTYTALWINLMDCTCGVEQKCHGNTKSVEEYLNHILYYEITTYDENSIDESALWNYLKSSEGQELLGRVCEGWHTEWDGYNEKGYLMGDATEAIDELISDIAGLPGVELSAWYAKEWLSSPTDLELNALTTDKGLWTLAEKLYEQAEDEGAVIVDSIYDVLEEWRNALLQEWVDRATDQFSSLWIYDSTITHQRFDEQTLEVEICFSDETRAVIHVTEEDAAIVVEPEAE